MKVKEGDRGKERGERERKREILIEHSKNWPLVIRYTTSHPLDGFRLN